MPHNSAIFTIVNVGHNGVVLIKDDCDGNQLSVTNDADGVVERLVKQFGPHIRIEYIDTEGNIDRLLVSKDGHFDGFGFGPWSCVA